MLFMLRPLNTEGIHFVYDKSSPKFIEPQQCLRGESMRAQESLSVSGSYTQDRAEARDTVPNMVSVKSIYERQRRLLGA